MACGHPMVGTENMWWSCFGSICLPSGNGHDYPVLLISNKVFYLLFLHNVALNYLLRLDWDIQYSSSISESLLCLWQLLTLSLLTTAIVIIAACNVIGSSVRSVD